MSGNNPESGEAATAVGLSGVTVELGDSRVLDSVDVTVDPGRFVGLVGPNGAGKTTLLRTVNGRAEPDAGSVAVCGDAVSGLSSKAIGRRVATVPQRTELSFSFPVRDVVEMGRFPHRSRLGIRDAGADRIDWAMERTAVAHLADRPVTETSGGERQRVLLARALAQDTPVLLLDEPTASLDVGHQVRTLALVRELVDEDDRTVLAAIHDLDLAARFCDSLLLLSDGRVRASGPPRAVLTETAIEGAFDTPAAVGRNHVTGSPTVTALSRPSRGAPGDRDGRRGQIHVIGGGGQAAPLLYRLVAAGYEVTLGVVHEDDPDAEVARGLGAEAVTVPPFSVVDGAVDAARGRGRDADATVLAGVDLGAANATNLEVAEAAARLVVVEDRPFAERNHAGEEAARRYASLEGDARVVSESECVAAVADEIEAGRAVAADGGE